MKQEKLFIVLYSVAVSMLPFGRILAQSNFNGKLEEAKKAIAANNELYFRAFSKNDASIFVSLFARDCWIMSPNAPTLCGPDAAGDFFQTAYKQFGIRNGKLITIDVYGISEDIVAEIGFFKLYNAGNMEIDDGKFLVLWKKTSGGWKMWRDSFNSSRSRKN